MMRVFLAGLLFAISAGPTLAEQARDNEAMVMRIIFEDCLGFVERDEAPFRGLDLIAISERGKEAFNAAAQASATMRHLFSTRYAAAWGEDEHARYCMIQTVQPPEGPMRLAVNPDGFLQRMTARASALGMTDVGRIQVGYRADLVVLDAQAANLRPVVNGTGIVVHSGSASNVQHVFVDGEHLVANGQPTRLDAQDVIDSAQSVADELWARARQA